MDSGSGVLGGEEDLGMNLKVEAGAIILGRGVVVWDGEGEKGTLGY